MDSVFKPIDRQHFLNMIYHPTRDLVVMTGFFAGYLGSITFFTPSSHTFETVFATEVGIEGARFLKDRTIIFALTGVLMFAPGFVTPPNLHISEYVPGDPTLLTMDLETRVVAPIELSAPVQTFDVAGNLCLVRTTALQSDSQLSVFDLSARRLLRQVRSGGGNPAIRCHGSDAVAAGSDK